jgi:hypothetical protein
MLATAPKDLIGRHNSRLTSVTNNPTSIKVIETKAKKSFCKLLFHFKELKNTRKKVLGITYTATLFLDQFIFNYEIYY